MQRFETPPKSPEEELAIDEALLLLSDEHGGEWLRFWEFQQPVAVLGRSSKIREEVDLEVCGELGVPVLRRSSGGASVVGGPGCLMYSVVLDLRRRPELAKIDAAHQFMMQRLRTAVSGQLTDVHFRGTCDLTWGNRKFSGNSLRIVRRSLLYHGTILYDADLELVGQCLASAPRQPDYRQGRGHREFIVNVPLQIEPLRQTLACQFGANARVAGDAPGLRGKVDQLLAERYRRPEWHQRH